MIEKRTNKLMEQLTDLTLAPSNQESPVQPKAKKIKVSKGKEEEGDENPVCEIDFGKLAKEDALGQVTVNDLKGFLTGVGQKPKRVKADLIEQVREYFSINLQD